MQKQNKKIKTTDVEKTKVLNKAQQQLYFINKEIAAGGMRKEFAELMISILNRFSNLEYRILKLEKKIN